MASCQVCSENAMTRCSKCKVAYYCSRAHQADDWQRHKQGCRKFGASQTPKAGIPSKVKAVLFPVEGGDPRIIDIAYKRDVPHMGQYKAQADFPSVLGRDARPWPTTIEIDGFKQGAPLGRTLSLVHNDLYTEQNKPLNKCIDAITQGQGYKWCDNLIGFREAASAYSSVPYEDVTQDDVRVFKKYFAEGGNGRDAFSPERERHMAELFEQHNVIRIDL